MRKLIGIAVMFVLIGNGFALDGDEPRLPEGFPEWKPTLEKKEYPKTNDDKFPLYRVVATGDYQSVGYKVYATHDSEDEVSYYTWLVGERKWTAIVQTVNPKGWGTLTVYGEGSFFDSSLIERLACKGDMGKLVEVYKPSQKEKYGRVLWNYECELPVEGIKYKLFWITMNYELYREVSSERIGSGEEQGRSYSSGWLDAYGWLALTVLATEGLNVRKGPGTEYGIVTKVVFRQELKELDYKNGWYKIETEDGIVGWVCGGEDGEVYVIGGSGFSQYEWEGSVDVDAVNKIVEDPYSGMTPLELLLRPGSSF